MNNPKSRKKLSELRKGCKNPFYGRCHTKDHINKLKQINSKSYEITTPGDDTYIIKNLNAFCRKNNLCISSMHLVLNGKQKLHKGYSCKRIKAVLKL